MLLLMAEVAKAEPSKLPFYIAGGAFAVWAVLVSALGITQPSFPGTAGGGRAVMLVSLALMAAAMITAVATS